MKKFHAFFLFCFLAIAGVTQSLTEVYVPQFIQGLNGTNITRVPFAYRVTLSGLTPNASYRYINNVVITGDLPTVNGSGNAIYAAGAGAFVRSSGPNINTANNFGTFTTDATGNYTGWFITEPSGNARFTPGNQVFFRISLNDGGVGTTVVTRLTTTSSATVIDFGASGANTGTGIRLTANNRFTASNFVMLYSNESGIGRPITGTFVESDGSPNTVANSYVDFYGNNVDGVGQTWGAIVPNILPDGIQRIQELSLTTGNPTAVITSADGVYPTTPVGTVDTKNPGGGTIELVIDGSVIILPVQLISFSAVPTGNHVMFNWKTASEIHTSRFEIEQSTNGRDFTTLATIAAAGNSTVEKSYSYTGSLNVATTYYRLKMIDTDGKFTTSSILKLITSKNGFALGNVYPVPAKNTVTIEWNSNRAGTTSIVVADISGRTIRNANVQAAEGFNQFILDVQSLPAGQYFIRLKNEMNQVQTTIIRQ